MKIDTGEQEVPAKEPRRQHGLKSEIITLVNTMPAPNRQCERADFLCALQFVLDKYGVEVTKWPDPPGSVAPFKDHKGNVIREGDEIIHPSGELGEVVKTEGDTPHDRWKVDYGDGVLSRLSLQVGKKGRAIVI